jgi:hypothetical protein
LGINPAYLNFTDANVVGTMVDGPTNSAPDKLRPTDREILALVAETFAVPQSTALIWLESMDVNSLWAYVGPVAVN